MVHYALSMAGLEWIQKRKRLTIILVLAVVVGGYIALPKWPLGEFFFERHPAFYHLGLAEFWFKQSLRFEHDAMGRPLPYTYYQLGRISFLNNNQEEALAYLNKEKELYPDHLDTYYMLGLVHGYRHEDKEAIESFTTFLEHKPDSWAARNDLAWIQYRSGDIRGGLRTIVPAVNQEDPNPWTLNTFGVLLLNSGDARLALDVLSKAYILAQRLNGDTWGLAYPGNNPAIYTAGVAAMRNSILRNIGAAEAKLNN